MANVLIVIAPYWYQGTWVFDDESTGLNKEPFVAGVPEMIAELVEKKLVDSVTNQLGSSTLLNIVVLLIRLSLFCRYISSPVLHGMYCVVEALNRHVSPIFSMVLFTKLFVDDTTPQ